MLNQLPARAAAAAAALVSLLLAGAAWAIPATPPGTGFLVLSLSIGGQEFDVGRIEGTPNDATEENPFDLTWEDGAWSDPDGTSLLTWERVSGDIDPLVTGVWAITNNTDSTQIYAFSVNLGVLPVGPSSLMGGGSTISVSDANGSGSGTLSTVGPPGYTGLVDLAPIAASELFADPYTLMAPPGFPIADTETFGAFPGTVPGPAVTSSIGIQHVFELSPGDSATLNSTFFLVAVPEAGTLTMMLTGLAGLAAAGRRRR